MRIILALVGFVGAVLLAVPAHAGTGSKDIAAKSDRELAQYSGAMVDNVLEQPQPWDFMDTEAQASVKRSNYRFAPAGTTLPIIAGIDMLAINRGEAQLIVPLRVAIAGSFYAQQASSKAPIVIANNVRVQANAACLAQAVLNQIELESGYKPSPTELDVLDHVEIVQTDGLNLNYAQALKRGGCSGNIDL